MKMKRNHLLIALLFLVGSTSLQAQCLISVIPDSVFVPCGDSATLVAAGSIGVLHDDFDGGTSSVWQNIYGGAAGVYCEPAPDGSDFMWFLDSIGPRYAVTQALDVSAGGNICFDFRMAIQGNASPCEGPDLSSEGMSLQYSLDNGVTWNQIHYFQPNTGGNTNALYTNSGDYTAWANYCISIPTIAQSTSTQFRFYQDYTSGTGFDHWGIDDVLISSSFTGLYNWGSGFTSTNDTAVLVISDSTYTVYFTDGFDTCSADVWVGTADLSVQAGVVNPVLCSGSLTQLNASVTGGSSVAGPGYYLWTPTTGIGLPTILNPTAGPSTTTTYTFTYSDPNNPVCTASDSVLVQVVPDFNFAITTNAQNPCITDSFQFDVNINPPANYSYQWTITQGNNLVSMSSTTISNPWVYANANGQVSWLLTITHPDGCVKTDTVSMEVLAGFPPSIAVSNDTTITLGDSVRLEVWQPFVNPNVTFSWEPAALFDDPTLLEQWVTPTNTTDFTVTATDTNVTCTAQRRIRITIPGTVGIMDEDFSLIRVYPNPGAGNYVMDVPEGYKNPRIEVFNALGQFVAVNTEQDGNQMAIELDAQPGLYFFRMFDGNKLMGIVRVMQQ